VTQTQGNQCVGSFHTSGGSGQSNSTEATEMLQASMVQYVQIALTHTADG